MADNEERRMLFDLRGRRRGVIKFIYAGLAILMAGGLLLFGIGGEVSGGLFEGLGIGGGSATDAGQVLEEQAERIEGRLARNPGDEGQLLALARTRIAAGNARMETDPETGTQVATSEARAEFEQGLQAWNRYLRQVKGGEVNPAAAQLVAGTYFSLAESSGTMREIESNIEGAAAAQRIAAEERPNIGSLSTLAIYEFFNGNFAAGNRATREAAARAPSKAEGRGVEEQLADYRKRGKEFAKQKREFAQIEREQGREALQNPLGGLATPGG